MYKWLYFVECAAYRKSYWLLLQHNNQCLYLHLPSITFLKHSHNYLSPLRRLLRTLTPTFFAKIKMSSLKSNAWKGPMYSTVCSTSWRESKCVRRGAQNTSGGLWQCSVTGREEVAETHLSHVMFTSELLFSGVDCQLYFIGIVHSWS